MDVLEAAWNEVHEAHAELCERAPIVQGDDAGDAHCGFAPSRATVMDYAD